MSNFKATLLERSKEDLVDELLIAKGQLRIAKLQSTWLDQLADSLRDDTEPDYTYSDYKKESKEIRDRYLKDYGVEL